MAHRFPARPLILAMLIAGTALAGCNPAPEPPPEARQFLPEQQLRDLSAAMQKTVLQGALAGAAVGTGLGLRLGGNQNKSQSGGIGFTLGLGAGAVAGSYVAFLQGRFATDEARLRQVRKDLDKNNREIETTLVVMREVLALQQGELAAIRARVAAGTADQAALQTELTDASANLAEMQKAIDGAQKRQGEFASTRNLRLYQRDTDGAAQAELDALAQRVAAMREVAGQLAQQL